MKRQKRSGEKRVGVGVFRRFHRKLKNFYRKYTLFVLRKKGRLFSQKKGSLAPRKKALMLFKTKSLSQLGKNKSLYTIYNKKGDLRLRKPPNLKLSIIILLYPTHPYGIRVIHLLECNLILLQTFLLHLYLSHLYLHP